ncbi:hypothetical protein [Clostridium algidicarnis]|uniref:hypothetical protein n=1 Tax=Clostridium algidicarnis TaxID=37659 RepID=UPI001C0C5CD4|nr:hypothetical protein [Clostridium algidicarnis]MBU3205013.1 hypothetical protein [Clostridium algidicarnis]MBU3213167.1 hypothetical protein [Clostridium algidicarnis]MBU3223222.1 hypothetical protein [Clostridium algidicarnis]
MSKNITKTLAATLAATLGAGIVPVMAQTSKSLDELHKAAYTAVAVAKKDKTQKSINDARVVLAEYKAAIEAEEKLGLLPNVNTFSVQLDEVQHPILSDIVKSILAIQKAGTATQAEINEVRTMLEGDQADETDDLPKGFDSYKKTWNADLDVYQTRLMDAAIEAVKTAETEKTQATVDAAKVLVADLATAVRPGIQKIAADLQTKVEAVEVSDLKVVDADVTTTGIEIKFSALPTTIKDVEIEVVDNKGKKIATKKVNRILVGATKQKFDFEKLYSSSQNDIYGTWTINGVKVDLTEKALVKTVVSGKTGAENALIALQEKEYITGLDGDYVKVTGTNVKRFAFTEIGKETGITAFDTYAEEIVKVLSKDTITTAKEIQAIVDKVNKANGISENEKELIAKVQVAAESSTATAEQLTNALENAGVVRVNGEWSKNVAEGYSNYASVVKTAATTEDMQKVIDDVNLENVKTAVKATEGNKDADKTKLSWYNIDSLVHLTELVTNFVNPEAVRSEAGKDVNEKDELLAKLNEQTALINVTLSDNAGVFAANLKKLSVASKDFDFDSMVYEESMMDYLKIMLDTDGKDNANAIKPESVKHLVTEVINTVNTKKEKIAVGKIQLAYNDAKLVSAKYDTKSQKAILDAFAELAKWTAKSKNKVNETTGDVEEYNKFDLSIVKEANLEKYNDITFAVPVVRDGKLTKEFTFEKTVNDIDTQIKDINNDQQLDVVIAAFKEVDKQANLEKELVAADLTKALSNPLLGLKNVVEANAAHYAKDAILFANTKDMTTKAGREAYKEVLNTAINTINAKVAMLTAKTTEEMYTGLNNLALSTTINVRTTVEKTGLETAKANAKKAQTELNEAKVVAAEAATAVTTAEAAAAEVLPATQEQKDAATAAADKVTEKTTAKTAAETALATAITEKAAADKVVEDAAGAATPEQTAAAKAAEDKVTEKTAAKTAAETALATAITAKTAADKVVADATAAKTAADKVVEDATAAKTAADADVKAKELVKESADKALETATSTTSQSVMKMTDSQRRDIAEEILNNRDGGTVDLSTVDGAVTAIVDNEVIATAKVTKVNELVSNAIASGNVDVDEKELATAIHKIDASQSVASLLRKIQPFVEASRARDEDGKIIAKKAVTYTSYTQIREALAKIK